VEGPEGRRRGPFEADGGSERASAALFIKKRVGLFRVVSLRGSEV